MTHRLLRPARAIFAKDLRQRLRDRSVLLFALLIPLGLTLVFSLVFPDEDVSIRVALVDHDGGALAAAFRDGPVAALADAGVVELIDLDADPVDAVRDGAVDAVWVVPDGFGAAVTSGQPSRLEVLVHPDRGLAAAVAEGAARRFAAGLDRAGLAVTTAIAMGADRQELDPLAAAAATRTPALSLVDLATPDRRLDGISYLSAGMAVFFVFFTVQFGVSGLLEERALNTRNRLLAAPISEAAVHLGKGAAAFVVGVTSVLVLAVAARLLLGAHWGPWLGVVVLTVAATVAALGIMSLVATFARTFEQAGNAQSVVALVLGLLGGVFFPVSGEILGRLARLSPHGWFLRGLGDQVGTGDWTAVLPAATAILAFGVATALPAAARLRAGAR